MKLTQVFVYYSKSVSASISGSSSLAIRLMSIRPGLSEPSVASSMNFDNSSRSRLSPITDSIWPSSSFCINPSASSSNSCNEFNSSYYDWVSNPLLERSDINSFIVKKPLFFLSTSYFNSLSSIFPMLCCKSLRIFGKSTVLTLPLLPKSKCLKISSTYAMSSSSSARNWA